MEEQKSAGQQAPSIKPQAITNQAQQQPKKKLPKKPFQQPQQTQQPVAQKC